MNVFAAPMRSATACMYRATSGSLSEERDMFVRKAETSPVGFIRMLKRCRLTDLLGPRCGCLQGDRHSLPAKSTMIRRYSYVWQFATLHAWHLHIQSKLDHVHASFRSNICPCYDWRILSRGYVVEACIKFRCNISDFFIDMQRLT